jgi:hypothetical protein
MAFVQAAGNRPGGAIVGAHSDGQACSVLSNWISKNQITLGSANYTPLAVQIRQLAVGLYIAPGQTTIVADRNPPVWNALLRCSGVEHNTAVVELNNLAFVQSIAGRVSA